MVDPSTATQKLADGQETDASNSFRSMSLGADHVPVPEVPAPDAAAEIGFAARLAPTREIEMIRPHMTSRDTLRLGHFGRQLSEEVRRLRRLVAAHAPDASADIDVPPQLRD